MDGENGADFDMEEVFINCLLRNSGEHSFTLISDVEFNFQTWKMFRRVRIVEPNILIFTNYPTSSILQKQIIDISLRSKWSLTVVIGTTTNEKYICNNGEMSMEMYNDLENFVNNIWQQYRTINLIIHFPFVCPNLFITYGNKTDVDFKTIYRRSLLLTPVEQSVNLISKGRCKELTQDYSLRVSIHRRFPTAINGTDCDGITNYLIFNDALSNGYCGLDGLVMSNIVEYFGFNITKNQFAAANTYGYVDNFGRVTGTLGNIVRDEIDISFNSRFLALYGVTGFHFLHYISSDQLCAIIKRSDKVPLWLFPYEVYTSLMWTMLITSLIIVGIFLWLSVKCSKSKYKKERFRRFILDSMITGLFGFSSMKTKFFILKGVCFFSSVIFTATFQSHVNYAYTTLVRYRQVNDLQELDDTGAKIITTTGIFNLIKPPLNDLHTRLIKKVIVDNNHTYTYQDVLIDRKDTSIARKSDMILETLKYYTDDNGQPLFHVIGECFKGFFLSFISNKDFPFTDDVIILVERLIEAGLPDQYYQWTQWSLGLFDTSGSMKNSVPRPTSPIILSDLRIAFSLLGIGYFVSIATLIIEKFIA